MNTNYVSTALLFFVGLAVCVMSNDLAFATVIHPIAALASNTGNATNSPISAVIDGSGLDPNYDLTSDAILLANHNQHADLPSAPNFYPGGAWWSQSSGNRAVTFDLGSVTTFNKLYIWNGGYAEYNTSTHVVTGDGTPWGVKDVSVYTTSTFNASTDVAPDTYIQDFVIAKQPDPFTGMSAGMYTASGRGLAYVVPVEEYTFNTPVTARYVKLLITSSYILPSASLAEVRFGYITDNAEIPEPSALLLAIIGASGLGLAVRRRKIRRA